MLRQLQRYFLLLAVQARSRQPAPLGLGPPAITPDPSFAVPAPHLRLNLSTNLRTRTLFFATERVKSNTVEDSRVVRVINDTILQFYRLMIDPFCPFVIPKPICMAQSLASRNHSTTHQ